MPMEASNIHWVVFSIDQREGFLARGIQSHPATMGEALVRLLVLSPLQGLQRHAGVWTPWSPPWPPTKQAGTAYSDHLARTSSRRPQVLVATFTNRFCN
jgi:hypothetical protein